MTNPIAFALDMSVEDADRLGALLAPHVGAFKVGLELFVASHKHGWWPTREISDNVPVILDLKLYDIPETVARAVKAGGDLGVKFMTIHVQQRKAIEEALKAAESYGITLLGVTVLTSMTDDDLEDLRMIDTHPRSLTIGTNPSKRAMSMTGFGHRCGLRGFVCSPQEVKELKGAYEDSFFLVPGVRPAGADLGDQKRVGTPAQAIQDGANLIVVGRPIRDAADPVQAAKDILASL